MSRLEVLDDYDFLEEDAFTIVKEDWSTLDWVNMAKSNIFRILFDQGHWKNDDPAIVLSPTISNNGFDLAIFIIEVKTQCCKQLA